MAPGAVLGESRCLRAHPVRIADPGPGGHGPVPGVAGVASAPLAARAVAGGGDHSAHREWVPAEGSGRSDRPGHRHAARAGWPVFPVRPRGHRYADVGTGGVAGRRLRGARAAPGPARPAPVGRPDADRCRDAAARLPLAHRPGGRFGAGDHRAGCAACGRRLVRRAEIGSGPTGTDRDRPEPIRAG